MCTYIVCIPLWVGGRGGATRTTHAQKEIRNSEKIAYNCAQVFYTSLNNSPG